MEGKFKKGDWITNGRYTKLIVGINSDWHYYMFKDGTSKRIKGIDEKYHLWTIQDPIWVVNGLFIPRDIGGISGWKETLMLISNGVQGKLRNWWNILNIIINFGEKW